MHLIYNKKNKSVKRPINLKLMLNCQYIITFFFLFICLISLYFGINEKDLRILSISLLVLPNILLSFVSIIGILQYKKWSKLFSVISCLYSLLCVICSQLIVNLLDIEMIAIQAMNVIPSFINYIIMSILILVLLSISFCFILSKKVKKYYKYRIRNQDQLVKKKIRIVFPFILFFMFIGIVDIFAYQPIAFNLNKALKAYLEPVKGSWESLDSFTIQEGNSKKSFFTLYEKGMVAYSFPSRNNTTSTGYVWSKNGYVVDIIDNKIFIGRYLWHNIYIKKFCFTLEIVNDQIVIDGVVYRKIE